MNSDTPRIDLEHRAALPEALRVLLEEYPRVGWQAHPNFTGLVQFWLERHLMFRKLLETLQKDSEMLLDHNLEAQQYTARLSRFGGMMLSQLHGHHQIEDQHYFPKLRQLDTRLERGFDILDKDHHALDGILDRFAKSANVALQAGFDNDALYEATGGFKNELGQFEVFLNRHLVDEEELIVPVILKNGVVGLD